MGALSHNAVVSQGGGFSGGVVPGDTTFSGNVIISGTLDVTGVATFTTTVTGSGDVAAGAAFSHLWTGRSRLKSSANGLVEGFANDGTTALSAFGFGTDTYIGRSAAAKIGLYGASLAVGASLAFASDKVVTFSSTTDPDGTVDTSIGRSAAGVVGFYSGTAQALGAAIALASDMGVRYSSTTDPDGTIDLVVGRSSAGVLALYNVTGRTTGASLALASDKFLTFAGDADPDTAADTSVVRVAAGIGGFGTGGSTLGAIRTGVGSAAAAGVQVGAVDVGLTSVSSTLGVTVGGTERHRFGTAGALIFISGGTVEFTDGTIRDAGLHYRPLCDARGRPLRDIQVQRVLAHPRLRQADPMVLHDRPGRGLRQRDHPRRRGGPQARHGVRRGW